MFDMREANDQFSSEDSNVRVLQEYIGHTDEGDNHMVRAVIEEINDDSMEEEHDEPLTMILENTAGAPGFPASWASAGGHR